MDAETLIAKSRDQRSRSRYEEALISATAATVQDPDNADGWWFIALNNISLSRKEAALEALIETNAKAPYFAQGWAKRGSLELELGDTKEAENAFKIALGYDEDMIEALGGLAKLYQDKDSSENIPQEIIILTKLDDLQGLDYHKLNRLGILHYRNKHGFDAIKYWMRKAYVTDDITTLFNLGLAYNMAEVSQTIDAIDCWRLVLRKTPSQDMDSKRIKTINELIQTAKAKLLEKASEVRTSRESLCLPVEQWYTNYINPFQLLNCPKNFNFEDFEPKIAQKWKKTLLQEIELEEGKLHWMPGLTIDRSKAIELIEKLSDKEIASYNWEVYKCEPLLEFLSKGDVNHFLLDEEWSPLDFFERVNISNELKEWLSEPFSIQYGHILSKAIAARDTPVIEVMVGGRRWVMPSYTDRCFENASQEMDSALIPLRNLKTLAETTKVETWQIYNAMDAEKIIKILNLLPTYFHNSQNEAVTLIRSMAIDANNVLNEPEIALEILKYCEEFTCKSIDLTYRLNEDVEAISNILKEQQKQEYNQDSFAINKFVVRKHGTLDKVSEITSLRWGVKVGQNGGYDYLFAANTKKGFEYQHNFGTIGRNISGHREHLDRQNERFSKLINAAFHFVIPKLMGRFHEDLMGGKTLAIGPINITQSGVSFESKWLFFSSHNNVPWIFVDVIIDNGMAIVINKSTGKKSVPISLRDVPNAVLLPIIPKLFNHN